MSQTLQENANKQAELQTEITTSPDRFQLKEIIGRGGMATVYRAFDTHTQRHVAVKVLYDHLREHALIVEHFRREVAIAQRLEHPNIVRIHSLLETPETLGLVMELHGDGDLKNHLMRHGPMPHKLVVDIGVQVLAALQSAHDQGIIHLDIKPHNILWDPLNQTAKIIDFGLAKTEQIIALARPQSAMGTVEYSAPEQFDDFSTDARADLYSLAITLFELLSNNLPYRSETAAGVIQMHRTAPPSDVRIFARGIPKHIAQTLLRAMAKTPEGRFANAHQMSLALQNQACTELTVLPRSKTWDELKKNHRQNPQPNNWNIYIPPSEFTDFNKQNPIIGTAYRRELTQILKKHHPNINPEHPLSKNEHSKSPEKFDERDFDHLFTDRAITKRPVTLSFSNTKGHTRQLEPIAFACNLTYEQAETIRQQLGRSGIPAKIFQKNITKKTSPQYRQQRDAFSNIIRFNRVMSSQFMSTLAPLLVIFVIIAIAATLSLINPIALIVWIAFVIFALVTKNINIQEYLGFHPHWKLTKLNFTAFYLLNFDPHKTQPITHELIGERHAEIYHQLRSNRVRASFERIILTLIYTPYQSVYKNRAPKILLQATDIATRVTQLEATLLTQDQTALISQLARLDAIIPITNDTHTTAELIEQRTALHQQLKQIDLNREELSNLNHQLLKIASNLELDQHPEPP